MRPLGIPTLLLISIEVIDNGLGYYFALWGDNFFNISNFDWPHTVVCGHSVHGNACLSL